ncbi:MAG: FtsX-like permease family protein [Candidatus Hodarchaeales archaeon]
MSHQKRKFITLFWLSKTNLKFVLASLIGLTIALSMLAGSVFYLEILRTDMCLEQVEQVLISNRLTFDTSTRVSSRSNPPLGELTVQDILTCKNWLDKLVNNYQLGNIMVNELYNPILIEFLAYFGDPIVEVPFHGLFGLNDSLLAESIENSRLPNDQDEVMVFAPDNSSLAISDLVNLSFIHSYVERFERVGNEVHYYQDVPLYHNRTFTVTGIIKPSTLENNSVLQRFLPKSSYYFFNELENYLSLIHTLEEELSFLAGRKVSYYTVITNYLFIIDNIERDNVVEVIDDLVTLVTLTYRSYTAVSLVVSSSFESGEIIDVNTVIFYNFFNFMVFSLPALVIIAVLVGLSLSFLDEKESDVIALLKTRGFSSDFVAILFLLEVLGIALLGTIIGMMLGLPVALFLNTSNGFLTFNIDEVATLPRISIDTLLNILLLGLVFTLLTHGRAIIKLAKSSIVILEEEASKKSKRKNRIFRGQLDLVLLVTGVLGVVTLNWLYDLLDFLSWQGLDLLEGFYPLLMILVIISPLLVLVGSILAYNRFLPIMLHQIGRFFWRMDFRLLTIATMNLKVNVKTTARISLLLGLAFSFILFLAVIPMTTQNYTVERIYYRNYGCDVFIDMDDLYSHSYSGDIDPDIEQNIIAALKNITGVRTTRVFKASLRSGSYYQAIFLGIEEDYHEVAHWQTIYDDETLEDLVATLYQATADNAVFVNSRKARQHQMDLHASLVLPVGINISIRGFFNYWPNLYTVRSDTITYFVGKYDYVRSLKADEPWRLGDIYGKIMPGNDPHLVVNEIRGVLEELGYGHVGVYSATESVEERVNFRDTLHYWTTVNFNFLAVFVVIQVTIILFSFTRIAGRSRESALARSLGMKMHQAFLLQILEPSMILLLGGVLGTLIGTLVAGGMLSATLSNFQAIPPVTIYMDIPVIMFVYGFTILVTSSLGMITAVKIIRGNISDVLNE